MTVLVTGGLGFIGSHLVDRLLDNNESVVIIDDFSTGNITNVKPNNNCTVIKMDITNKGVLSEVFNTYKPNKVFHLAAIASVKKSIDDPIRTHDVNVLGTNNVFECAISIKCETVVFASSAAVYGNSFSTNEFFMPHPLSPYGNQKLMNEYSAKRSATDNTKFVGLRFFNVYGPRQNPNSEYSGVISIFVNKILNNEPITIYGNGTQTRDFVNVADIVSALILASNHTPEFDVFNVGTNKCISILDIAQLIYLITGKNENIKYDTAREGDIKHSLADISRIHYDTGYYPKIGLYDGMKELIGYIKE